MSTIKVTSIQNAATTNGGIAIGTDGHVTVDGLQMPNAGALSNRNLIINGAMQVAQRGTSTSVSSATPDFYLIDRFFHLVVGSAVTTYSQEADSPAGFANSLKLAPTTASASLAASDQYKLEHRIEGLNVAHLGWGTANAQTVTLSFWIKSNLTGNTQVAVVNSANDRFYVATFTIDSANTWEKKTLTVPGDTTGTWLTDNTIGIRLRWGSFGTDLQTSTLDQWHAVSGNQHNSRSDSPINFASSTSNTLYLTGVQLEVGSTATPYEHRSYSDELAKCMRYYEHSSDYADPSWKTRSWEYAGQGLTRAQANGNADYFVQFTVPKRETPNVTYYSATGVEGNVAWEKPGVSNDPNVVPSGLGTTINRQIFRIRVSNVSQDAWLFCNWEAHAEL